jgi:glycosyltransferase involved in cell wall biosynthesis
VAGLTEVTRDDRSLRICIVYDCIYPWNVGGAERWYRGFAEAATERGHQVTYLTRRVWPADAAPALAGIDVVGVSPGGELYTRSGRRRILPPLRFGLGVYLHLLRHRRAYDVVHASSFPYFSLLAIRAALARRRVAVGVDWFEVWSGHYWRSYVGRFGGALGSLVQAVCIRLTPLAIAYSDLSEHRLRSIGVPAVVRPGGMYVGTKEPVARPATSPPPPKVVYFGRHIPEKRVHLLPAAVSLARRELPELTASIYGAGPESDAIRAEIDRLGLGDVIDMPGFVDEGAVGAAMSGAMCLVNLSSREGYGLVVVESSSYGTPVVVAAAEDNAAVELVDGGVNGYVADADPEAIAEAILRVHRAGSPLRASAAAWFADNAERVDGARSIEAILARYGDAVA